MLIYKFVNDYKKKKKEPGEIFLNTKYNCYQKYNLNSKYYAKYHTTILN